MSNTKKSTNGGVKVEAAENFIPLYTKNVERLAEMQKKSLATIAEQNAEFIGTCKKAFEFAPGPPACSCSTCLGRPSIVLWRPRKAPLTWPSSRAPR